MTAAAHFMGETGLSAHSIFPISYNDDTIVIPDTEIRARALGVFQGPISMTNIPSDPVEDEDEEEDDYDFEEFGGDEEWEDNPAAQKLYDEMPKGWTMVKCVDFTYRTITEMEKWLAQHCRKSFKRVGFRSGCSYTVGVQFEDNVDAMMFKLRWR